jgi:hypothetical protein
MFHLVLSDTDSRTVADAVDAWADAFAAWNDVAAHAAAFAPKTADPARPPVDTAAWSAEAYAVWNRAAAANWRAWMETARALSTAPSAGWAPNPFGVTGWFASTAPAPASAPKPAADAREAASSTPDDLTAIKGIGPKVRDALYGMGIFRYWQIAQLTEPEIAAINDKLKFKGRVEREGWVDQAKALLAEA